MEHAGERLDLEGYELSFSDDFDKPDIGPDGADVRWFSPVHASFGAARFPKDPASDPPVFRFEKGVLSLRLVKADDGWRGAMMQSVDGQGRGFAQRRGYFEARVKLPHGAGAWPAFWLYSVATFTDRTRPRAEIDVLEYYGGDPRGHHSTVHLRSGGDPAAAKFPHWMKSRRTIAPDLADDQWHTVGCEVTGQWIIIYLDRAEVKRIAIRPEFDTPLYMLLDLTLFGKEADHAVSPQDFQVDYVRVWRRDAAATPAGPPAP